jgi:hypothetical protein
MYGLIRFIVAFVIREGLTVVCTVRRDRPISDAVSFTACFSMALRHGSPSTQETNGTAQPSARVVVEHDSGVIAFATAFVASATPIVAAPSMQARRRFGSRASALQHGS